MPNSKNGALLQVANIIAFFATFIVNLLASFSGLNGRATGQISDLFPALFTPAGYVFSIWTIIYTLLLIFTMYQALPRNRDRGFMADIGYLFVLNCIANITWLFLWHWLYPAISVILMFILLGTLIAIYLKLNIGRSEASRNEKLAVHLPFSVYLGWITVAPVANVSAALISLGWNGGSLGPVIWTNIVLVIALIITIAVLVTRADVAFGLVLIWALSGIVVKNSGEPSIVFTSEAAMVIIALVLIWIAYGILSTRGVEKPKYNVIRKTKGYEIRQYGDMVAAEIETSGDLGSSLRSGFNALANYIFGNNSRRESIAMTSPVSIEERASEKISMTAPVMQELKGKGSVVSFIMPSKYTVESLPVPNNSAIRIRVIKARKVAAWVFWGRVTDSKFGIMQNAFVKALGADGIEISGMLLAQYNPPFTLPSMRRNELLAEIKQGA
ncbi:MAG: heme-binding protein [Candidatus Methanomethylicus sp.]|nr:heme-binding protein [Candidatus Methanomethylicus sp.]